MNPRWMMAYRIVHEADGLAGGATPPAADPGTTPAAPADLAAPAAPASPDARPEWLPEKFADAAALAKAYGELEAWKGQKAETLKAEAIATLREGVPAAAADYAFEVPKDLLPEGFQAEIPKDDPFLAQMKETFHQLGAKPDQFQAAAEAFLRWQVANMPDVVAERAKLGEGAPDRIAAVDAWLAKSLSPEQYRAVSSGLVSAEGVLAMEAMMKMATGGAPNGMPGGGDAVMPSQEEASAIAAHPQYRAATPEGEKLRARFQAFVAGGGKLAGYQGGTFGR
jgi:hypothetical protein